MKRSRIELHQDKQEAIEKEAKQGKQKKLVKLLVKILLFLLVFIFGTCLYITKVGTISLMVNEQTIESDKLPPHFHGLKVIQFSDIHYENDQLLQKVVHAINLRKPDLVLFTGDLLGEETLDTEQRKVLVAQLKKITSTIGNYAVLGENDTEEAISILTDCHFTILDDSYDLIYNEGLSPLLLIGLNTNHDTLNLEQAFDYYQQSDHNEDIFTIAMFHKPLYIETILQQHSVDLALAGHSHHGQVRIPNVISFVDKDQVGRYQGGYYQLDTTQFYISSGIGTSKYPYRFNARPSINFFRLESKNT